MLLFYKDKVVNLLDDLDYQILRLLQSDGRSSFREVAKQLGVSTATVSLRVRRMEEAKIIEGFHVHLNYPKLGKGLMAMMTMNVDPGKMDEVAKQLSSFPEVTAVQLLAGPNNFHIEAIVENQEALREFIDKKLSKISGVQLLNFATVIKQYKRTLLPV